MSPLPVFGSAKASDDRRSRVEISNGFFISPPLFSRIVRPTSMLSSLKISQGFSIVYEFSSVQDLPAQFNISRRPGPQPKRRTLVDAGTLMSSRRNRRGCLWFSAIGRLSRWSSPHPNLFANRFEPNTARRSNTGSKKHETGVVKRPIGDVGW